MPEIKPWHEQDAFWEAFEPVLFPQRRLSDAAAQVEKVLALLGIQPGAVILDLGCGIGRHSVELARRGFHVTGVDRTQAYLNKAVEKAKASGLQVEFVREDMRAFCRPEAFDVVMSFFTSFGYFDDPEDDRRVAMNAHRSLKAGGIFFLEMMGKEILARNLQQRVWREEDGLLVLEEWKISKNWSWVDHRWIVLAGDDRHELRFSHRPIRRRNLPPCLAAVGLW